MADGVRWLGYMICKIGMEDIDDHHACYEGEYEGT